MCYISFRKLISVISCLLAVVSTTEIKLLAQECPHEVWSRFEETAKEKGGLIFVDKQRMTLTLFDSSGVVRFEEKIACGKNYGTKQKSGDMRTPEGLFAVQQIQKSHTWVHDFNDGKGVIEGAYGPWFIRLKTPFNGIGIHGTHAPESIGSRATEGCIRLQNDNLRRLQPLVSIGMPVYIAPGKKDTMVNSKLNN